MENMNNVQQANKTCSLLMIYCYALTSPVPLCVYAGCCCCDEYEHLISSEKVNEIYKICGSNEKQEFVFRETEVIAAKLFIGLTEGVCENLQQ